MRIHDQVAPHSVVLGSFVVRGWRSQGWTQMEVVDRKITNLGVGARSRCIVVVLLEHELWWCESYPLAGNPGYDHPVFDFIRCPFCR